MKRLLLLTIFCLLIAIGDSWAQSFRGTTGLLQMPTADMQRDKTVMLGGGYLAKEATPSDWYYDTWNYYMNVTIFPWLEMAYTCTLFKAEHLGLGPYGYDGFTNQDRNFSARLRVWKEGWWKWWTPQIVLGVNDFTSGSGGDYTNLGVEGTGNGYFNRYYIAATKHLDLNRWNMPGTIGIHACYLHNKRTNDKLNDPAVGLDYTLPLNQIKGMPQWMNLLSEVRLMAEYYPNAINIGANIAIWKDHINLTGELYQCKHPSIGLYFKIHLK